MKTFTAGIAVAFAFVLLIGAGGSVQAFHNEPVNKVRGGWGGMHRADGNKCEVGDYVAIGENGKPVCQHFPGGACPGGQVVVLHHPNGPRCLPTVDVLDPDSPTYCDLNPGDTAVCG